MVSKVDNNVKFYFENGRLRSAVKFHSPHHAPHATETIFSIFDTLQKKNLISAATATKFQKFTATLIPPEEPNESSRLLIQSNTAAVHIKTLKPETAALLIDGLTPGESTRMARILECLTWFIQGMLTLATEVLKSRNSPIISLNTPEHSFINSTIGGLEDEDYLETAQIITVLRELEDQVADWQQEVLQMKQSKGLFSACFDANFQRRIHNIDETMTRIKNLQIQKNQLKVS